MTKPTLTGLFFTKECGCGEHYQTGVIVRQVHPDAYLARCDRMSGDMPVNPLVLFTVSEDMASTDEEGDPIFRFFETKEDLRNWIDWLNTPVEKEPSVVKLVKPEQRH